MKIAIVTDAIYPFTLGGSEVRNHEVAKRLVKKGHEMHIYGIKFWKGKSVINIDGVIVHGISAKKKLYSKAGKRNPIDYARFSKRLFFRLMKERFDLIDVASFNFFNCYSMRLLSAIKGNKLVFTWHQYLGDYLIGYFGGVKGRISMILERMSTKLAKNNIAVSENVKNKLVKKGVKRVRVISNGADIKLAKSVKAKKKYDIIFIGRLNYQKNLGLLVRSVHMIKKKNIKACIIGEGEEKEKLQKFIRKLDLEKNFEFTGRIEDKKKIFKYLKSSKIFALPSILEGFPITMIEANACGIPVVTTKTKWNNVAEYIEDNKNGVLARPFPEEFSQAILAVLKNHKNMKKECEKAAKNYDWDKITEEQERYYRAL